MIECSMLNIRRFLTQTFYSNTVIFIHLGDEMQGTELDSEKTLNLDDVLWLSSLFVFGRRLARVH